MLGAGAIARAVAWSVAAALGVIAILSFAALLIPALKNETAAQYGAGIAAGALVLFYLLWRARHIGSESRVALWIEEKVPALQYSLVTAIEHRSAPDISGMEAAVAREDIGAVIRRTVGRAVGPAIGGAALAAALLYVSPSAAFGGGGVFSRLAGSPGAAVPAGSRLEDIIVRIVPPAYARERSQVLDDPGLVSALVGSRVTVQGDGAVSGIGASAGSTPLAIARAGSGWTASLTMPARPAALTLRDRQYERIIVLEPRLDKPPRVALTSPARDSTLRLPRLVLALDATATDDVGLAAGYFEYLVTSGSGEVFSARTVTTPVVGFGGQKRAGLRASLDLSSLGLQQGDVVSIRAIVQDVNTLSGPGLATSDTRTYRIARADEYDSVAVDAAGPTPLDSSAMSQRMLILMTEQLVRDRGRITRDELVRRSTEIGEQEERIRNRVHEILYDQAGEDVHGAPVDMMDEIEAHDHTDEPVPANFELLEAYNALWDAVRSLRIAEPEPALPPMRIALRALDKVRLANRLYLRGLPPKVIVDLARVRLTGKEKGTTNLRTPLTRADSLRVRIERRFAEAIDMIESKPEDAIRALTLLQVEVLASSPGFASAVGEAVLAMRRGRDATVPLLRARRTLSGDPAGASGLPAWSDGW